MSQRTGDYQKAV